MIDKKWSPILAAGRVRELLETLGALGQIRRVDQQRRVSAPVPP